MSVLESSFMLKYNFYEKNIAQYAKVKIITLINDAYLIEDVTTKNRAWVMYYDIYPLYNHDLYGDWVYSEVYQNIAKKHNLL